jgi:hypothetical protein
MVVEPEAVIAGVAAGLSIAIDNVEAGPDPHENVPVTDIVPETAPDPAKTTTLLVFAPD